MHWLICRIQAKSSCILTLLYLPLKFPLEICISSLSCTTLSPLCRCPVKDDNCLSAAIRERSHFSSWKIWIGRGRNCFLTVAMWVRALLASFLNVQTEYSRLSYSTHTHTHLPLPISLSPSLGTSRMFVPKHSHKHSVANALLSDASASACRREPVQPPLTATPLLVLWPPCSTPLPACLRQRLIICSDNTLALTGAHRLR